MWDLRERGFARCKRKRDSSSPVVVWNIWITETYSLYMVHTCTYHGYTSRMATNSSVVYEIIAVSVHRTDMYQGQKSESGESNRNMLIYVIMLQKSF